MEQETAENLFKDIKKLEKKYSLSANEILDILKKKESISIPLCIFNEKLGSLEAIVKYLRENLKLSYKEISFLTARSPQALRSTYERSRKKFPEKLVIDNMRSLPIRILAEKKFSVLENIASCLFGSGFTISEISFMLKRDYKTIWTILERVKNKT